VAGRTTRSSTQRDSGVRVDRAVVLVITRVVRVAGGRFAPGHVGELTRIVPFEMVDAVLADTGTVESRVRLLPSRAVVYLLLLRRCSLIEDTHLRVLHGDEEIAVRPRQSLKPITRLHVTGNGRHTQLTSSMSRRQTVNHVPSPAH
jgi:hypothetical protein